MWCGRLLHDPPPFPALPAEGRESESHTTLFVMTTNQRLHPSHSHSANVPSGTLKYADK